MRRRRDPFGRQTFVPVREGTSCDFCGQVDPRHAKALPIIMDGRPQARIYRVRVEPDGGRQSMVDGEFCSWSCAEAYTGMEFAR